MGDLVPRGRAAERIAAAELLDALHGYAATHSESMARLQALIANDGLRVETVTIPAEGYVTRQWHAVCGVIEVYALGANPVTVTTGGPQGQVPTAGVGVAVI